MKKKINKIIKNGWLWLTNRKEYKSHQQQRIEFDYQISKKNQWEFEFYIKNMEEILKKELKKKKLMEENTNILESRKKLKKDCTSKEIEEKIKYSKILKMVEETQRTILFCKWMEIRHLI